MPATQPTRIQPISEAAVDTDLPEGWAVTKLKSGIVKSVQPGFACGVNNRRGEGIAHLRPMNVTTEGRVDLTNLKYVPESRVDRDKRWLTTGDVLFNNTDSPELVGKTAFYDLPEPKAFSNHMTRIRCNSDVLNPRFYAMALLAKWQQGYFLTVCSHHVSQSSVSRNVLFETPIPLPPLPEQKRIVAKVQALFAEVTKARERLAKVPLILKRFGQSVLAAACSGRLTTSTKTGTEEWEVVEMQTLFLNSPQNGLYKSSDFEEPNSGTALLDIKGLYKGYCADFFGCRKFRLGETEIDKYRLEKGDLLINRVSKKPEGVGKSVLVCELLETTVFESNMIRLKLNDRVTPAYINYFLHSSEARDKILAKSKITSQASINQTDIKTLIVPLPPLEEQKEIVRRVEALFTLADMIEKRVEAATTRAEKLTQSILAKAFRGELVPTEAELARRENRTYEPASTLLEKIESTRTGKAKETKKRKSTIRKPRKQSQQKGLPYTSQ